MCPDHRLLPSHVPVVTQWEPGETSETTSHFFPSVLINTSFSITETLRPYSPTPQIPPHSPYIAPGTHLVWWSATRCLPTLFLYALTKHSAPFCHEPDCFSLCPIHYCHSLCLILFPIYSTWSTFPISTVCLNYSLPFSLALLTFNCFFSSNSLLLILPFLSALPCSPLTLPLITHSHTQPFMVFPQFHSIYPHSAVHPHLCLWVPASLHLITYMAHHARLPPGLQEAGVQNQPEGKT